MSSAVLRTIKKSLSTLEGRGAMVNRLFPTRELLHLDPFVLFDEFHVEKPAGFPMHHHSGFEFITYMLEGSFIHRDTMGNEEQISAGGAQWASTGRGISHSEMPGSEGVNHGIQLWINLPRSKKKMDPEYQLLPPSSLMMKEFEWGSARIIADEGSHLKTITPIDYLDISLEAGKIYEGPIPDNSNTLIYVLEGKIEVEGNPIAPHHAAILNPGGQLRAKMVEDTRFLYLSGKPIGEPIEIIGSTVR